LGEINGTDKEFKTFASMTYGYRAAFLTLATYLSRGWNTIEKIISHWAPPTENNTEEYIKNVEKRSNVPRNQILTANNGVEYIKIVEAMSFIENGIDADFKQIKRGFELQNKTKKQ
jgi:hypothetical protein